MIACTKAWQKTMRGTRNMVVSICRDGISTTRRERFSFSDEGKARIICDIVVIGTTIPGQWQWSWGNQKADERNREDTKPLLDWGNQRQWAGLTDLFRDADEYTGWECASVANHILGGKAVYRFAYGPEDQNYCYLLIQQTHRIN